MAYSPTAFTANTPIEATAIEAALEGLRLFVNRGIEANDFQGEIVRTEDVLEGDPVGATRTDYWAVSGDVHAQHGDSARVNRQYLTGTTATRADYAPSYFLEQYPPGCMKQFTVERDAIVIITVWVMTIAGESNLSLNTVNPMSTVFLNGGRSGASTISQATLGQIFVEDSALAAPGGGPQPAGSPLNRRPYNITWVESMAPGTYKYGLFVSLHSEKMFVSARNLTIEVLYL